MNLALFRPRTVWLPTWRGWLLALVLLALFALFAARTIHPFLAVTDRVPADLLVVDGWQPDDALRAAMAEFQSGGYRFLCTAGGPVTRGILLADFASHAELCAATLLKLGFDESRLIVAPAPESKRNRTFVSATAVREKLIQRRVEPQGINLITSGIHARRSRLVYRKVFGPDMPMGVISRPSESYDPTRWWASSEGLKGVITESLALTYEYLADCGRIWE
jgi:uncharacterized SAM-binding protein YcdF (DUF218 family)